MAMLDGDGYDGGGHESDGSGGGDGGGGDGYGGDGYGGDDGGGCGADGPAPLTGGDGTGAPATGADAGPLPRLLCDTEALAALTQAPAGALWKLSEPGRQLDANVVHLEPGRHIGTHIEPDLDVILLVLAGHGSLGTERGPQELTAGNLLWLPHGSSRSLTAGTEGLRCLTVHRRRAGLRIRGRGPDAGG
jgi:quercetin dioxygenase-like cupin family protein